MIRGDEVMFEIKAKATKLIDDTSYPEIVLIEFYDFDAKYVKDTNVMIPAKIDKKLEKEIREYAIIIFKALGLRNLSRIDFLYDNDTQKLYFNEVNTIPGFNTISMFPKLMMKHFSYKELITKLIENAN